MPEECRFVEFVRDISSHLGSMRVREIAFFGPRALFTPVGPCKCVESLHDHADRRSGVAGAGVAGALAWRPHVKGTSARIAFLWFVKKSVG